MKRRRLFAVIFLLLAGTVAYFGIRPMWVKHLREARAKQLMSLAHSIHQALFAYASSHDQEFPRLAVNGGALNSSNDAFRQLFVAGLLDSEAFFFAEGSPWCVGNKPDGVIGNAQNQFAAAVAPGENFWAYCVGLKADRDPAVSPLLMDGFTAERMDGGPDRRTSKYDGFRFVLRLGGSVGISEATNTDANLKAELGPAQILMPASVP